MSWQEALTFIGLWIGVGAVITEAHLLALCSWAHREYEEFYERNPNRGTGYAVRAVLWPITLFALLFRILLRLRR